ncbi:hypothetical protein V3C99_014649 [Haemonchus contortus]
MESDSNANTRAIMRDSWNEAKQHSHDVADIHSHPPENPQKVAIRYHSPRNSEEETGVHSYPPELRFHDSPADVYSYRHPSYAAGIHSYPPEALSEKTEDIHEYPPDVEQMDYDYLPLPFVSDYGNIASHMSGTFYHHQATKGNRIREKGRGRYGKYDPFSPRRFEKAKMRSKLKESSILQQVPPEVRMSLRNMGGTSSLRELANAKVLFDFDQSESGLESSKNKEAPPDTRQPSSSSRMAQLLSGTASLKSTSTSDVDPTIKDAPQKPFFFVEPGSVQTTPTLPWTKTTGEVTTGTRGTFVGNSVKQNGFTQSVPAQTTTTEPRSSQTTATVSWSPNTNELAARTQGTPQSVLCRCDTVVQSVSAQTTSWVPVPIQSTITEPSRATISVTATTTHGTPLAISIIPFPNPWQLKLRLRCQESPVTALWLQGLLKHL